MTPSTPAPSVQPTRVDELSARTTVVLPAAPLPATEPPTLTSPYARPPVAYSSTVGVTSAPIRPLAVPNQSSFWFKVVTMSVPTSAHPTQVIVDDPRSPLP